MGREKYVELEEVAGKEILKAMNEVVTVNYLIKRGEESTEMIWACVTHVFSSESLNYVGVLVLRED